MISVTVLSVSEGELRRLEVLRDVERGGLPVSAAAQLLGRSERQVWRLLKAFRSDGVSGLISKKRGRPSNRKMARLAGSAQNGQGTECCANERLCDIKLP